MDSPKFLSEEIAFVTRRIEQLRNSVGLAQAANANLLKSLSSNDQVLANFLEKQAKVIASETESQPSQPRSESTASKRKLTVAKVSTSTYPSVVKKLTGLVSAEDADLEMLQAVYVYQCRAIEKLQAKLKTKDETKKSLDADIKEVRKKVDRATKLNKEMNKSREKAKERILSLLQEECDMKNKAAFMNVEVSMISRDSRDDARSMVEDSPKPSQSALKKKEEAFNENKLIRKSTAKLKPMKSPIE